MDAVLGIAEARSSLPSIVDRLVSRTIDGVIIGAHRRPEAVIVSFETFQSLTVAPSVSVDLRAVLAKSELTERLGQSRGISNIAVFGSIARGDERPDSDIDFLVDAAPGTTLFDLAGFESDLELLFGRPVDVVSRGSLRPDRQRDARILSEAVAL